jgi:eukaryotic-like serine/threonine-protein kinase
VTAPRGTSFGTREQLISPAISPDGTRLVFRVLRQAEPVLAVRAIDALDAQILPGTEGALFAFWSPDSRTIGFFAGGKLQTIGGAGGPIQKICDASRGAGGTWNREGVIVFAPGGPAGLFTVPAGGGQVSALTTLQKNETSHRFPQFLPDGRRFLYFAEPNALYLGSIDGGPSVRVLTSDFGGRYASPGYLLFEQDRALFAQRFDADGPRLTGEPMQIGEGLMALPGSGETPFSMSDNGRLAYATSPVGNVRLAWVDRAGRSVQSVGPFPFGRYADPELSPDGKSIAMDSVPAPRTETAPWSNQEVWVFDVDHGRSTQLTFDPASDEHPIWSPDGKQLVFLSRRQGAEGLYQKPASNEKPEELLLRGDGLFPSDWSTKGIVYDSGGPAADLWLLPLAGDRKPYALVSDASLQVGARFSSDGRWFAYQSNELGRPEIFVRSFPPSAKWRISTDGGSQPRWRGDGKELFYLAADGKLMTVRVGSDGRGFKSETPQPLFQTGLNGLYPRLRSYGVSNDGDRFLITVPEDPSATPSIVVVSNWAKARP